MEKLVELDLGFVPVPVLDSPVLIHGETHCTLTFGARASDADPDRTPIGMAVIDFKGCLASRFGYPNDEALGGHPLYRAGLRWYSAYEVIDSSWLAEVNRQNSVSFPTGKGISRRHFIATFKESTFECLGMTS
jgi:hypothetical protein